MRGERKEWRGKWEQIRCRGGVAMIKTWRAVETEMRFLEAQRRTLAHTHTRPHTVASQCRLATSCQRERTALHI